MNCDREGATHHLACDCREAAMSADIARLTRERDEAMECAAKIPGLRLRLAQTEESATQAETAWKTEYKRRVAAEARAAAAEKERDEARERAERPWEALAQDWQLQADLERAGRIAAEAKAERLAKGLREIADECDCDFPRCQSTIARAALVEEGKS